MSGVKHRSEIEETPEVAEQSDIMNGMFTKELYDVQTRASILNKHIGSQFENFF